jgi:hypothetical protein
MPQSDTVRSILSQAQQILRIEATAIILAVAAGVELIFLLILLRARSKAKKEIQALTEKTNELQPYYDKYKDIPIAEKRVEELQAMASSIEKAAIANAKEVRDAYAREALASIDEERRSCIAIVQTALDQEQSIAKRIQQKIESASSRAEQILKQANQEAARVAGDALRALDEENTLKAEIEALRNRREGYGDQYIIPPNALLDELMIDYGYTDAAKRLKEAKDNSKRIVKAGEAVAHDEASKPVADAIAAAVLGSFDGECASIIDSAKTVNYGKLNKRLQDAYTLANSYAKHIYNSKVDWSYYMSRMSELQWACVLWELKRQDQEQQREAREKMRDEERARKEIEKAKKEADKEKAMYERLLAQATAQADKASDARKAEFDAKVLELQSRLREAEEMGRRAVSMAQQTKQGTVYVISNIGSFGENVYKIGMTRRLDPRERVNELGDASVPFDFDIHALIKSDDAPALEAELHRTLASTQVNKVNSRKEFFRTPIERIKSCVDSKGLDVTWTIAAEAAQYRETQRIEQMIRDNPDELRRWEAAMGETKHSADDSPDDDIRMAG